MWLNDGQKNVRQVSQERKHNLLKKINDRQGTDATDERLVQ